MNCILLKLANVGPPRNNRVVEFPDTIHVGGVSKRILLRLNEAVGPSGSFAVVSFKHPIANALDVISISDVNTMVFCGHKNSSDGVEAESGIFLIASIKSISLDMQLAVVVELLLVGTIVAGILLAVGTKVVTDVATVFVSLIVGTNDDSKDDGGVVAELE